MYVLLTFILITLIGILITYIVDKRDKYSDNILGPVLIFIGLIISLFLIIFIPFCRISDRKNIARYTVIKNTISESRRNNISDLERVQLLTEIIQTNTSISDLKFDNQGQWDLWTVDEVDSLKYIQ